MSADIYSSRRDFFVDTNRIDYAWSMKNSHLHNSYEIYYLVEGNRLILIRDKVYELYAGDLVLLRPNVFHRSMGDCPHERFNIVFTENTLSEYFTHISSEHLTACFREEFIRLNSNENKCFTSLYERLKKEYETGAPFFVTLAEVLRLLCDASDRKKREPLTAEKILSKGSKKVNLITHYIIENYNSISSIDDIAASCYLNKSYMCRLFKKETGMTVFEYLNQIKIQNACEMMKTNKDSITDIAMKCGFSSASYFSYTFKELMACTPSDFRKRIY